MEELVSKMGMRRAIILLGVSMALLFLASSLLPTKPSAQTTSPEGKIVYEKLGDIWVMNADGTDQTNLTNTPDIIERQPTFSLDGAKIAFTRPATNQDGDLLEIYVMDADGTNQTNLTNTPNFDEYQPSWAPSGAQLAFVREVRKEDLPGQIVSEQDDIFVMDANGENATNITQTEANEREPAWSPDGTKIAVAGVRGPRGEGGWEILTMDPDGQNEMILTGDTFEGEDRAPDWSPDSTKVVFQKQCQGVCSDKWEIWGVNRDGSGDTNLTNHEADDMGPSWSPDGSEITFTRTLPSVDGGQSDIYAMPAPATLPPPGETASATTSQDSSGAMDFAAGDVLVRAASAQTTSETALRRLTTDGLSSEPDWADAPADTTPPKVMSTSPANNTTMIAPGVNVTATFSEAMDASTTDGDASTINGTTFKLVRLNADGTTTRVTAAVRYVATTKKAILDPASNLSSRRTYKATVTSGAQDLAGNALDQNPNIAGNQSKNWKFTVQ